MRLGSFLPQFTMVPLRQTQGSKVESGLPRLEGGGTLERLEEVALRLTQKGGE